MQECFYFPLTPRLKALLGTKYIRDLLEHESSRPKDENLMSDIYDTPAWKKLMGEPTTPNRRMAFQVRGDSIPAFTARTKSIKPIEIFNWSYPPSIRTKTEYMMLWMIIDSKLKGREQRKYWNFAASYELNKL